MTSASVQAEALANATQSGSLANYPAIYAGFTEKGIPESEIRPRENVFTYNAWKALGRQVRLGEHGVKVVTWVPMTFKSADSGDSADNSSAPRHGARRPKTTTVFHITQTDPMTERAD